MSDEVMIRSITEDLPVGVWAARAPGGELLYANAMFAEIMGIAATSDVAVGEYAAPYGICKPDGTLYPEMEMPFVRALRERVTVVQDDIVIHRRDGRKVNIRASARPVFGADGAISHVVIAFIDITREVEAERARREAERRLRHGNRMESVGTLAGGIAHDFNNLLATIKMTASTLRLGETDPRKQAGLGLIDQVTHSAVQLTSTLLSFARRGRHRPVRISLNEVVQNVFQIASRTIERRIEVALDLCDGQDAVMGDFSMLEQVVMNLVVNARDAIPEAGAITLRTRCHGPDVVLEVRDTGTGIPPDIRDRIFEPYFTTKTQGPRRGSGLGLATVHGIVQMHQGTVEVEDNPIRGTVMRVVLPAAPQEAVAPARVRAKVAEQARVAPGSGKILLAEDAPLVRAAVELGLRELGYEVLLAEDGDQALGLFRQHHLGLRAVILDLMVSRFGTVEAFRQMQEINPAVPVYVSCGEGSDEALRQLVALGARGMISKPYDLATLSRTLGGSGA